MRVRNRRFMPNAGVAARDGAGRAYDACPIRLFTQSDNTRELSIRVCWRLVSGHVERARLNMTQEERGVMIFVHANAFTGVGL